MNQFVKWQQNKNQRKNDQLLKAKWAFIAKQGFSVQDANNNGKLIFEEFIRLYDYMNIWFKFYFSKNITLFESDDKMMTKHEFTQFCSQIGIFNLKTIKELFESLLNTENNADSISM